VQAEVLAAGAATGGAVLASLTSWLVNRRSQTATVELTEKQADDIMTQTAERVVRMQEVERQQLARRIRDLEAEVTRLRDMVEARELREAELTRDLEQLRGERENLRQELGQLRAQLAAKEAELSAARHEIADLRLLAVNPPAAA
jgi:chromosome segregation ATPase